MYKLIIILLCAFAITVNAQKPLADKKFKLYEYSAAIPLYQDYLKHNPDDYEAVLNLANCFRLTNDVDNAIISYKTVIGLTNATAQDWFDLVQLLRIQGDMKEAKQYALQLQGKENSERVKNLLRSINEHEKFLATRDNYIIKNETSDYTQSVFAATPYNNGLLVTAASPDKEKNNWTGNGYTKLFTTNMNFSKFLPFAPELMSSYNDGPAIISADGTEIYFTSVNADLFKEKEVNTRNLIIICAERVNGKWEQTERFQYNSSSYNIAHPALSADGTMLIFSSDKPGGKGGMDLYYCLRNDNVVHWGEPINIGILNTSENEIMPTLDNNDNLYFSSNGLPGLGGLDIFSCKISGTVFSDPINLNAPLNSSFDDFSLFTNNNLQTGYASSNRFGNTESDDVFYFAEKEPVKDIIDERTTIKINVIDKYTSEPLAYVSVSLKDDKNNIVYKGLTDPQGAIMIEKILAGNYEVQGILNDITTTVAKIDATEFIHPLIEKTITHNDPRFTLSGIVVNAADGKPVEGVTVFCINTTINNRNSAITTANGKFFFQLEQNSDFKVEGRKSNFFTNATEVTTMGLDRSQDLYVNLELKVEQIEIGKAIVLQNIYYDLDKANIRVDAALELDKLVTLLYENPGITIELGSHTDSRGGDDYNLRLSQRRAESAVAYIISKGIETNRISAKGYGETRLTNNCGNGILCAEPEHQANRRTEFKVIRINN